MITLLFKTVDVNSEKKLNTNILVVIMVVKCDKIKDPKPENGHQGVIRGRGEGR